MATEGEGGGTGGGAGGNGGAAGGGGGGGGAEAPKTVAKENFDAVVTAKAALEVQVAGLKTELQKAMERASTLDTVSAELNQWKGKATAAEEKFTVYTDWARHLGVTDPDVIDAFEAKHRAIPEANRPARDAWLGTLKEKPDEAPVVLRPWLAPKDPANGGGQGASERREQPVNPANRTTQPGAKAAFTADEIRAAKDEAVRSGNWTRYREMSVAMGLRPAAAAK